MSRPIQAKARRAEMERRLREIRDRETTIKEKIYRLEASITAAPGMESARRISLWNTIPAEPEAPGRKPVRPLRYQKQLESHARSSQALTSLVLLIIAAALVCFLLYLARQHGVSVF